jgi:hypothetical protein
MLIALLQNCHRGRKRRTGKNFFAGLATIVVLSYATVVLACSCIHDEWFDSAGAPYVLRATIRAETAHDGRVERLCESVRKLPSSAVSNQSFGGSELPYTGGAAYGDGPVYTVILAGFRPPGPGFAHDGLSFQLHSILRI